MRLIVKECAPTDHEKRIANWFRLYTHPAPQQKPLTRDQVKVLCAEAGYAHSPVQARADFINGIRHAEAAHEIGEKK